MNRQRPYLKYLFILVCSILSYIGKAQCWERVYDLSPSLGQVLSTSHLDQDYVWILLGDISSQEYKLINSIDGGNNWDEKVIEPLTILESDYCSIYFKDALMGYLGSRKLYKTENGGENWTLLESFDRYIKEIIITDEISIVQLGELGNPNIAIAAEDDTLWSLLFEEMFFYRITDITVTSGGAIWISGTLPGPEEIPILLNSTNSGETWDTMYPPEVILDIDFIDDDIGWIGSNENIYKTINGGMDLFGDFTPQGQPGMSYFFNLSFRNNTLGWIGGGEQDMLINQTNPIIEITTNGGLSWEEQFLPILRREEPPSIENLEYHILELFMTSDSTGIAVSLGPRVIVYRYRGRPSACGPIPVTLEESSLYPMYTWPEAEGCFDGYYLQLGTLPGGDDILAQIDVGLDTFYQLVEALPEETEVYATVLPYNHVYGVSSACESSSFTTITCPPSPIVVDTGYCKGGSLLWGDSLINVPGQYTFPGVRENGCDSTVLVNVIQYEDPVTPIDTFYCQGDLFYWQDSLLSGTGTYKFTYLAASGCDSTVIITLEEIPLAYAQIDTLICEGEQYEGQDTILSEAGVYYFTYAGASGCDSTLQLNLEISPTYVLQLDTFFCEGEPFPWGDSLLTEAGQYEFIYQTIAGCDSSWHINLEVYQNVYTQLDTALQSGVPYDGMYYPNDTLLTFTYPGANGCDSIVQVQLDILNASTSPISSPSYKLYPNPAKEVLYLESSEPINDIIMWNALGQSIHVRHESGQIGIKQLPTGLYFIRFKIAGQWYLERVVLE